MLSDTVLIRCTAIAKTLTKRNDRRSKDKDDHETRGQTDDSTRQNREKEQRPAEQKQHETEEAKGAHKSETNVTKCLVTREIECHEMRC